MLEESVTRNGISVYAPGSIASMILGVIGLLVALYPVAAALLGVFGLFLLFFVIPLTGAFLGLMAIIIQAKTRKYLKRRSMVRGAIMAKIGLITGIVALVIGCSIAGAYLYITQDLKAKPSEPDVKAKVSLYENKNYEEILHFVQNDIGHIL